MSPYASSELFDSEPTSASSSVQRSAIEFSINDKDTDNLHSGLDLTKVKVTIFNTQTRNEGPKGWTEYLIRVVLPPLQWKITKRYSLFFDLNERILKGHPRASLPYFPPKRSIGNLNPEFVADRKDQLQRYLDELIKNPEIIRCKELKYFLVCD